MLNINSRNSRKGVVQKWSTVPDETDQIKESEESTMKLTNSKWSTDAEMSMMGFTIRVESEEHLAYLVEYVLTTVSGQYLYNIENKTKEVVENATRKYRSGKDKSIYWFTVNTTVFGACLTFVRDKGELTLKSGSMKPSGSLAWVENLDAPDCSELGYVFFENKNGKIHRIA